eukprot:EC823265.1.p1 GENE.EC823265.1~~EC823265.1.p1  ORF type:complete len:131 (+),score=51.89 EC823265.1:8-400(+)
MKPAGPIYNKDIEQQETIRSEIIKQLLDPYFEQNDLNKEFVIVTVKGNGEEVSCYHIKEKDTLRELAIISKSKFTIYHHQYKINNFESHFYTLRNEIEKEVQESCQENNLNYTNVPIVQVGKRRRLIGPK